MLEGNTTVLIEIAGLILTIFAAIWSLAWWLSGQFTALRNLIYAQVDKLEQHFSDKLEYHERHDDSRFNGLQNDLWEIKMRNAAIRGLYASTEDGELTPLSKKVKKLLKDEQL